MGSGDIKVDNVYLNFGSRVSLKNISFEIPGNKTTAIVGVSGSGKTSIANLLVRFYDPSDGVVSINGQDLKSIRISSLREKIALVTQDNIIFNSEIRDNILYGNQQASDDDIINITKHSSIHDFISKLPRGYRTYAGSCGDDLSGSQKQLIAISRALIKDADILIFDEATSALDQKKEMEIKHALSKLRANKTNIIIAHRLSSIVDADKIIVMNAGKVVEEGTHQELLNLKNHYYSLYNAQNINLE
jgi:ABC-type multidrug transport system fused ATPase/permease subunit